MKPTFLCLTSLAALSLSLPVLAQTGAGTPPLTSNSNTNAPLPHTLKLAENALPATVTTYKPRYQRGQPVQILFLIRNTTAKPITYNFANGQKFDITIKNAAGSVVWNWSRGRVFTQNLTAVTIRPKKSQPFTVRWNGADQSGRTVKPGVYTINARLLSNNRPSITGGVIVNTDRDPNNMGHPTQAPADTGAVRQVAPAPQITASRTITIL